MLSLLRNVEAISASRNRAKLHYTLLRTVSLLLGGKADVGIFACAPQGEATLRLCSGPTIMNSALALWPPLLDQVRSDGRDITRVVHGRVCGALMLQASELGGEPLILAYGTDHGPQSKPADEVSGEIAVLARIYGNQIRLLDYSELDSLTRLLNRKTFDETFDRLLTPPTPDEDEVMDERRHAAQNDSPAWLAVIDIDHFKRINDSFGHLFGDEVLLRMGELMRKTFRSGDRLFRFGGEEFVVLLNAPDEAQALATFERFRISVESHPFPQVGTVTCSIGFTAVAETDVPTDVVGRADEALYFAKDNGRNRVSCYERLLGDGLIARKEEAPAGTDFDIDALFDLK